MPREDGSVSVTDTIIVSGKVTDTGGASASRERAKHCIQMIRKPCARNVTPAVLIGVYSRLNYRI